MMAAAARRAGVLYPRSHRQVWPLPNPCPFSLVTQQAAAERRPWQCMAGEVGTVVPAHGRRDGSGMGTHAGCRAVTCCCRQHDPPCRAHCRVLWRGPCVCTGHDSPRSPFRLTPRKVVGSAARERRRGFDGFSGLLTTVLSDVRRF